MAKSGNEGKTDLVIQQEIIAEYDNQAKEIIDEYLAKFPDHDISDCYDFALGGISYFLHASDHYNVEVPDDIRDKYIRMRMQIIPLDFDFITDIKQAIERGGKAVN